MISSRLRRRTFTKFRMPAPLAGCAFQITLNAACNSPNTPVAAMTSAPRPTRVAMMPELVPLALRNIAWMAPALSLPTSAAI